MGLETLRHREGRTFEDKEENQEGQGEVSDLCVGPISAQGE
jgi:hypothetical protein